MNTLVDIGCLVTFIPSLVSGLVLYLYLAEGRGLGWAIFWGIPRNQWVAMHNNVSLVFAALLIFHMLLHWRFFRHMNRALNSTGCEDTNKIG